MEVCTLPVEQPERNTAFEQSTLEMVLQRKVRGGSVVQTEGYRHEGFEEVLRGLVAFDVAVI